MLRVHPPHIYLGHAFCDQVATNQEMEQLIYDFRLAKEEYGMDVADMEAELLDLMGGMGITEDD